MQRHYSFNLFLFLLSKLVFFSFFFSYMIDVTLFTVVQG